MPRKRDLSAIPDDDLSDEMLRRPELLKTTWARRNAILGGLARSTPTSDPAVLAFREKEAKRMRERRKQKKRATANA